MDGERGKKEKRREWIGRVLVTFPLIDISSAPLGRDVRGWDGTDGDGGLLNESVRTVLCTYFGIPLLHHSHSKSWRDGGTDRGAVLLKPQVERSAVRLISPALHPKRSWT